MKELFEKSLRMIKYGNIKTVKQYRGLMTQFELMSVESLKYITGRNFKDIRKLAQEY